MKGSIDHVTTLIGVSVNERPVLGIIHKAGLTHDNNRGKTYFGGLHTGTFSLDSFDTEMLKSASGRKDLKK